MTTKKHPLVGKCFHSYEAERPTVIQWQGLVRAEVAPGQFLVQLFEWFAGTPTKQVIVAVADMARWDFYDSPQAMNTAYEIYSERRNREFDAEHGDGTQPVTP